MDNRITQNRNIYNPGLSYNAKPTKNDESVNDIQKESVTNSDIKTKKYSIGIGIVASVFIVGALIFSKGFQKSATKYLNNIQDRLKRTLDVSVLSKSGKKAKFYGKTIRSIDSFLKKSESINNITSLKDVLFKKLMYKTKVTKNIHESITKWFEELSIKTINNSYKKTEQEFNKMYKIFDDLDNLILKDNADEIIEYEQKHYSKRELIKQAKGYRDDVKMFLDAFMQKNAMQHRYNVIKESTSTLTSKFWDVSFKDFWTKNNKFKRKEMWQNFVAAEQVKGDKAILAKNVAYIRNLVSYSEHDKMDVMTYYLKLLKDIIPYSDTESHDIIDKLKWFVQNPEITTNSKETFLKELKKIENKTYKNKDEIINTTQKNNKNAYIELIKNQLDEQELGVLKDMLKIYYKIAPFELEKIGALDSLKRSVKSLDKSIKLETIEFFDKARDLELGSAPTDILTIVLSFISITFGLGYAKDKDERFSIILKSGIPILGAISVSLISATKLISGGKSLLWGGISGLILNQTGIISDKFRKKIPADRTKSLTKV